MQLQSETRTDFSVYDSSGRLALEVEAKGRPGLSAEWAARYRKNLRSGGWLSGGQFFLLAAPDRFFLWHAGSGSKAPDDVIDAALLLSPFYERAGTTAHEVRPEAFEFIVGSWLYSLVDDGCEEPALVDSGLVAAVAGGRVVPTL